MMRRMATLLACLVAWPAHAAEVLSLADALAMARAKHPQLQQARAQVQSVAARADAAHAPLMPQVAGVASYQRGYAGRTPNAESTGAYQVGVNASWLLYDYGQARSKWQALRETSQGQAARELATQLQVDVGVRIAWQALRAAQAMVAVAHETLANQDRHLRQVQAFVEVGKRPAVDLAQARVDKANAEVNRIGAESDLDTARAQLALAMGVDLTPTVRAAEVASAPVAGEDAALDVLLGEALQQRPEMLAWQHDHQAQQFTLAQARGGYGPSVAVQAGTSEGGVDVGHLAWNWNAGLTLQWPIYQGGQTDAAVRTAVADLLSVQAQRDVLARQVQLDVDKARLLLRASKAALGAAGEAQAAALVRLKLAEGRYQAGVGTLLEMADAQMSVYQTAAQQVQADYKLAVARAQLLAALGRR